MSTKSWLWAGGRFPHKEHVALYYFLTLTDTAMANEVRAVTFLVLVGSPLPGQVDRY